MNGVPRRIGNRNSARAVLAALGVPAFGLAGLAMAFASSPGGAPQQKPTPEQATFFETKVRPVLADNCLACHGQNLQMAGLRLDSLAGMLKGGASGPCLVPGDPDKSRLVLAIRQTGPLKMPKGGKLKPQEVADIEAWVKMGAPWPSGGPVKSDQRDPWWSLQPVKKPPIPRVKNAAWVRNSIDAFVLADIEAKKLTPAPPADRRTLMRRVTYDLTGLPPTAEEIDGFVTDKSPNAYEKVVDRLLNSPQYGERWARHWLDVARYADTKGYVFEEDRNYPNAYTYRDWVINAINSDLPYDRFILEQLAADRLPEVQNSDDKRPLAALGFLTIGRRFLNQQPDIIDDRIDVTMRGFEGFTVGCARCHDHKFDPIPTQDYYSLYSVFASSSEVSAPISDKAIRDPWERYSQQIAAVERDFTAALVEQVKRLRELEKNPDSSKTLSPEVKQALQALRLDQVPSGKPLEVLMKAFEPAAHDHLVDLQGEADRLRRTAPTTPEFAMAMQDNAHPGDGFVFKRGNPGSRGETAPRRFLLALSKPGEERPHWTQDSGRLELAEAIASPDNPLTARVFVNRVWQGHFGVGIVRTPSDFGHQGERPTNQALLDYLAATFVENGWSMRKLHRLIVTSATYRQSSTVTPATYNGDPDNRLWTRMNRQRLDLEEMRDSLMFVAGKLDTRDIGGKSVDLWSQPFTERRAAYGFIERQNLPGIFRTFDFASPDSTSPKRFVTTVPQQALFFMNSPLVVEEARAVAARPEVGSAPDDASRVKNLYRVLFGRWPNAQEVSIGLSYLRRQALATVDSPLVAWQYGFGALDAERTVSFTPLTHFQDGGYRVGAKFPDPSLGYLILNAAGGHPGHDRAHCVIRRWVAPADLTVDIRGTLAHRQSEGDGVHGLIVSSRNGLLGQWDVHNGKASTDVKTVAVHKGDTLDFVVDPKASDAYDAFSWAPIISSQGGKETWDASANFGPPPGAPMTRLMLYAQALMMTNEFSFVD